MTQDEQISTMYVLNMAYQRLQNFGEDKNREYMKALRDLAQRFTSPETLKERITVLETQRETCLKTVKQLQEQVRELQLINKRYGEKIFDTDRAINDAMSHIEMVPADSTLAAEYCEEAYSILDAALCNFPKELIDVKVTVKE